MIPFPVAVSVAALPAAAVTLTCVAQAGRVLVTVSATDRIVRDTRFALVVTGRAGNRIVQRGIATRAQPGAVLASARIGDDGAWSATLRDIDADAPIASCRAGERPPG
jgi:nitrous oxidase accessory protein NosD